MRSIVISTLLSLLIVMPTLAQTAAPVACGNIVEGDFTLDTQRHDYSIELKGGDSIRVSIIPLGPTLETTIQFRGPTGQEVDRSHVARAVELMPSIEPPVLAASGTYTIMVGNSQIEADGDLSTQPWDLGGVGIYTLYIGCTLRDGTVIEPGDVVEATPTETAPVSPTCTGLCFAGVPAMDLSNGGRNALSNGTPAIGAIAPSGEEILGYVFSARADDGLNVTVERLSGNLNLGLVILDSNSQVIYQASLGASELMSTRLRIPSEGEYVASVYRLETLPAISPETTAFSIQIDLME